MSHFAKMQVNFRVKNERELILALEEVFGKGKVEVYKTAEPLKGMDSAAKRSAHIIVRKVNVAKANKQKYAYNDLGFERNSDGSYSFHVDPMDFNKEMQGQLTQLYSLKVSERELKLKGYSWKKIQQKDGTIKLIATKFS